MPLLANKTAERDIRAYLSQSGFSGRTARFEELELAAIERPGWVQVFRFRVRARRSEHVIERILRHCGLWEGPLRTLASARGPPRRTPQVPDEPVRPGIGARRASSWRPSWASQVRIGPASCTWYSKSKFL
jgi:hypothetical protein